MCKTSCQGSQEGTQTKLFLSITRQPAEPFSFPREIPFGHLFPLGLQSESNLNGTLTGLHIKYSKNYSQCKKRWKDNSKRNPCSPLPAMTGMVSQTYLILATLFVIFRMEMKPSSLPSPLNLHKFFKRDKTPCLPFVAECLLCISFNARIPLLGGP